MSDCQTCGGSGGQWEQTHATYGGEWWEPCPDCGERGKSLEEVAVERAMKLVAAAKAEREERP